MAFEQRDNSAALFKNERKEKDSHPDRKGSGMIGGVEYWISGWVKEGANGKFLTLAFEVKRDDQKRKEEAPRNLVAAADFDDDIPF